jgi:hypothetical protein
MFGFPFKERKRLEELELEAIENVERFKKVIARLAGLERRLAVVEAETELVEVDTDQEQEGDERGAL